VQKTDGRLNFAYIDPKNVDKISLKSDNALIKESLKIKGFSDIFKIVNTPEDQIDKGVFLFQDKKLINATRGMGVLMPVIDLLGSLDDLMFSELERVSFLKYFVWDFTLQGYTDEQIKDWVKNRQAPKPGGVWAHNEKMSMQAITPDLKVTDTANLFRLFYSGVCVGFGFPEHWLGTFGHDINRATAAEMNDPPLKRMEKRQERVKNNIKLLIDFMLVQAKKYKRQTKNGMLKEKTSPAGQSPIN